MTASAFFEIFFANIYFFLMVMTLTSVALFLSVRRVAPAGYLDPLHFYWTFTFGTAYGVVVTLYLLGHVSSYIFFVVLIYAVIFIGAFRFFIKYPSALLRKCVALFLIPRGKGFFEFCCALVVYIALLFLIIYFVGIGIFADTNRFEQNRGFGALVRAADAIRLFVVAYMSILVSEGFKHGQKKGRYLLLLIVLIFLIVLGAMVNGAKFALLEALYGVFVAMTIFYSAKLKFKIVRSLILFLAVLSFALIALSINLDKNNFDRDSGPSYISGNSVLVERIFLRILGNADKYYLSLPNNVIDELETDSVAVRFTAPLVGTTRLSSFLGYKVNDYNVGRQILLYFNPEREVAGGPTSHFDLFSYKYFGLSFGWVWVIFSAFFLASLVFLARSGKGNIFYASLVAALWTRSLAILLEPPVGFAYVIDIFFLFFVIKVVGTLVPRKEISNAVAC